MATFSITSSATQTEASLPERGIVTEVTVGGRDWSWRQSGVDDSTIDFAPAIPAGLAVVVTYIPTPIPALDLSGVNALIAGKADTSALAAKADVADLEALAAAAATKTEVNAKADAAAVSTALAAKADKTYVDAQIAAVPTGGADSLAQLNDKDSFDIVAVNDPLKAALAAKASQAALDSLSSTVSGLSVSAGGFIDSTFAPAIKLDLVSGRRLGDVGTPGLHTQVADLTLVPDTGAVLDGNASFTIKTDGVHSIDYSEFDFKGPNTPDPAVSRYFDFAAIKRHNAKPALYAVAGDIVPPSALLTATNQTLPASIDLSGYRDWIRLRFGLAGADLQAADSTLLSITRVGTLGSSIGGGDSGSYVFPDTPIPTIVIPDCVNTNDDAVGGFSEARVCVIYDNLGDGTPRFGITMPAGTTTQYVDVLWGEARLDQYNVTGTAGIAAVLSDGSAPQVMVASAQPSVDSGANLYLTRFAFKAATNGQTMTVWFINPSITNVGGLTMMGFVGLV